MTKQELLKHLGKELKKLLIEQEVSATQFAEMLGVSRQAASRYLNGKTTLDNTLSVFNLLGKEINLEVVIKEMTNAS
jgi:transcriptional regulator with XRE-family HTH domain